MHIVEMCGSWVDHPFWRNRFTLECAEDVQRLRESDVREVVIDTEKGLDVEAPPARAAANDAAAGAEPAPATPARPAAHEAEHARGTPDHVPFEEELEQAARLYRKAKPQVVSMFQEARLGKAIDAGRAAALVEEIGASVKRNPDALISLARLKNSNPHP